jgi:hypothetical protein
MLSLRILGIRCNKGIVKALNTNPNNKCNAALVPNLFLEEMSSAEVIVKIIIINWSNL